MMLIKNDLVKVTLFGALSFASLSGEKLSVSLNLPSSFELRAVAGDSEIQVREFDGDFLAKSGVQIIHRAAYRVLDYLGAPHVGLVISGESKWVLPYGATYDSVLAVAGTLLAAGLAPANILTEEELIELAVQSGANAELAVVLVRGAAALVWTKEAERGVRYLPLALEKRPATLLVSKNFYALGRNGIEFRALNFGLLTAYMSDLSTAFTTEMLAKATAMSASENHAYAPVAKLVAYLQELGIPALASAGGEAVLVFASLDRELVEQAEAAAWRVAPVSFMPEGAQIEASLLA
ncbi:hypothetical protein NXS08_01085 [Gleimia sp. 6138-11-ORH1]|uniref:hypothetical protein n=1 Tax=Gleimia sp. 6138-11-ORH1 TaxID=2973937 RepID=UPI002169AEBE|nr:hypothetical protein [Gleimia sp. 6138-11-ORH1]MCS4484086.1 hypothetical protein [Gleimia sp. 6138-11-ORH1]